MISLDTEGVESRSLEIKLGGAPAAELNWLSSWAISTEDDVALESLTGTTNGTTAVEIVPSPAADSEINYLKGFYSKNQNSASVTMIVQINEDTVVKELYRVTLAQHDTLQYNVDRGWFVTDASGAIKIVISTSAEGIVLVQVNPTAANLTNGYTVPTGKKFSGHINVCNRSVATAMRGSVAPNGAADDVSQYLFYDLPISANNVYDSSEFKADALDVVRVYATLATLTFTITGEEKNA